jgi:hypothetical protein
MLEQHQHVRRCARCGVQSCVASGKYRLQSACGCSSQPTLESAWSKGTPVISSLATLCAPAPTMVLFRLPNCRSAGSHSQNAPRYTGGRFKYE